MTSRAPQLIIVFLLIGRLISAQTSESAFKKECVAIVTAFAKQDLAALNKYIDKRTGVYIITRPGAIDALNHFDSLDNKAFASYPYKDVKVAKGLTPKFGAAPKYNCGDEKWNKKGFLADTTHSTRMSELMDFLGKNGMGNFSEAELTQVKTLESKSRKVVYTELAKKHGIVFHLTFINKKWRLTLIDAVASDCGA
jgi:hypothetical protein